MSNNKTMKKSFVLSVFCLLVAVAFVSCEKKKQQEWSKFYGYAIDDISGQYSYSEAPDAFSGLIESDEGHLCPDAEVSVSPTSAQTVLVNVVCPERNFQKCFSGRPNLNANAFLIDMYGSMINFKRYGITAEVLKNAEDDVRLKGFVTEDHFVRVYDNVAQAYDTLYDYSIKYYFDVIKN